MKIRIPIVFIFSLGLGACASAPKLDASKLSTPEAAAWFERFCSKGPRDLTGTLVVQANTREFKGQHPASLRFDPKGTFTLEVTHILGGTLLRLTSDGKALDVEAPSKPNANRKGVTHYMGIEVPLLRALLMGDLPCPEEWKKTTPKIEGPAVQVLSYPWVWSYTRAAGSGKGSSELVPFGLDLVPAGKSDSKLKIELRFDEWDREKNFAKKVRIHTEEGDLKWVWRARNP
jgi:hypothetical protein